MQQSKPWPVDAVFPKLTFMNVSGLRGSFCGTALVLHQATIVSFVALELTEPDAPYTFLSAQFPRLLHLCCRTLPEHWKDAEAPRLASLSCSATQAHLSDQRMERFATLEYIDFFAPTRSETNKSLLWAAEVFPRLKFMRLSNTMVTPSADALARAKELRPALQITRDRSPGWTY